MESFTKRAIVAGVLALFGIVVVSFLIFNKKNSTPKPVTSNVVEVVATSSRSVIGKSVQNRTIEAYRYGNGKTELLFVGGIHGGYEWNTVVLAYKLIDYLDANPTVVPDSLSVVVIPSLNPDGVYKITNKEGRFTPSDVPRGAVTSPGRFNANTVDLNRNFDCKWQPKSVWQNKTVSAGSKPFSEPEAVVLKNYIEKNNPRVVIFWHSQGGEVYASECQNGIIPETLDVMNLYAKASGYGANPTYDAYQTTGDADSWLARIGVSAITVELKTHDSVEWEQNLLGIKAVIQHYGSLKQ